MKTKKNMHGIKSGKDSVDTGRRLWRRNDRAIQLVLNND